MHDANPCFVAPARPRDGRTGGPGGIPSTSDERPGEVRLAHGPLVIEAATATLLGDDHVGALVHFTGFVRADPLPDGTPTEALAFEAYPEMALAELAAIRDAAFHHYDITGATIHHRTGTVARTEPIVIVAVAAAHRRPAFEAAAWIMDEVKHRVPLWKEEIGADGSRRWVEGHECGRTKQG
jgi:molybdopterin synthase catalytic subunit